MNDYYISNKILIDYVKKYDLTIKDLTVIKKTDIQGELLLYDKSNNKVGYFYFYIDRETKELFIETVKKECDLPIKLFKIML